MITRARTMAGALALCALAFAAFGTAGASAKGLTAVKCVEVGVGGNYANAKCATPEPGTLFNTIALTETTEIEGTSTSATEGEEETELAATLGGLKVAVKCKVSHIVRGNVTNVTVGEEMKIHGTNVVFTNTECKAALASNPAKTCEVEDVTGSEHMKGMITTRPLTSTTTGTEHNIKTEAEESGSITQFKILTTGTECFFKTAVSVEVTGSVEGEANTSLHNHLTFTKANNGAGLKANGAAANFIGTFGTWMKGNQNERVGAETF